MRDRHLVEPVNDLGSDRKGFSIHYTDNKSDSNEDMKEEEDAEDEKLDCK